MISITVLHSEGPRFSCHWNQVFFWTQLLSFGYMNLPEKFAINPDIAWLVRDFYSLWHWPKQKIPADFLLRPMPQTTLAFLLHGVLIAIVLKVTDIFSGHDSYCRLSWLWAMHPAVSSVQLWWKFRTRHIYCSIFLTSFMWRTVPRLYCAHVITCLYCCWRMQWPETTVTQKSKDLRGSDMLKPSV